MERYEHQLLPVCQEIHSAYNGASDPLNNATLDLYIRFLRLRIATWTPTKEPFQEFDTAVLSLCLIALREAVDMQRQQGTLE